MKIKKRFWVLFFVLLLPGGVSFGNDLGLTAGLDFGIMDFEHSSETAYIRPMLIYQNSFIYGTELYAEVGVPFWFNPKSWMAVDFTLMVTQNIAITNRGTVSLILQSQTGITVVNAFWLYPLASWLSEYRPVVFSPVLRGLVSTKGEYFGSASAIGGNAGYVSWLSPGIKYIHSLNELSFFFQVDIPVLVLVGNPYYDSFDVVDLDLTFGINTDLGIGLEVEINSWLSRAWIFNRHFRFLTLIPSYETGPFYGEAAFRIPVFEGYMDIKRMTIVPELRFKIQQKTRIYLNLSINHIEHTGNFYPFWLQSPVFSMGSGVKFCF